MFEMINKHENRGIYYTNYHYESIDWLEMVNSIVDNGFEIKKIQVSDSYGDIGLKLGGGEYLYHQFVEYYDDEIKNYCDEMYIVFNDPYMGISLEDVRRNAILYTADPDLDLNDMVAKKQPEEEEQAEN